MNAGSSRPENRSPAGRRPGQHRATEQDRGDNNGNYRRYPCSAAQRSFDIVGFPGKVVRNGEVPVSSGGVFQRERTFLSAATSPNILTEVSIYGIIAVGMTYVILTGGVDLAVGSLLAAFAPAGAYVVVNHFGGDGFCRPISLLIGTLATCMARR